MDVDKIADKHLKASGRALRENDELRLVAEMIDASVKERMGMLGTNKVPTPLSEADMTALAEIMAAAAFKAVSEQMNELRRDLEIMHAELNAVASFVFEQREKQVQAINVGIDRKRMSVIYRMLAALRLYRLTV